VPAPRAQRSCSPPPPPPPHLKAHGVALLPAEGGDVALHLGDHRVHHVAGSRLLDVKQATHGPGRRLQAGQHGACVGGRAARQVHWRANRQAGRQANAMLCLLGTHRNACPSPCMWPRPLAGLRPSAGCSQRGPSGRGAWRVQGCRSCPGWSPQEAAPPACRGSCCHHPGCLQSKQMPMSQTTGMLGGLPTHPCCPAALRPPPVPVCACQPTCPAPAHCVATYHPGRHCCRCWWS